VQQNDEVAFLGECKFWGGEKLFLETVEQLLTYLTSRDLLTAVIVFNRNKAVSAVVDRVAETVRAHPLFEHDFEADLERRTLRFKFRHPRAEHLRMDLAVLIYDL
jgi:RNase adaptor protein for sRNA GlmZ degradation